MSAFNVLASLNEDHFQCSLCLNVFNDPITTPCGHNFCRACLSQHWDRTELCHCPMCNKRFYVRPEFSTNTVIAEISEQIKRRKVETLENMDVLGQVACDICTEIKFKATKSCLVCLASYCEPHLEPHHRVPSLMRHELIEPVENLEERVCKKHGRILEFFCRDDHVCICLLCAETDHEFHETVSVEVEANKEREDMESTKATIKMMMDERREKIEEFTNSSEMRNQQADKEIEGCGKLFNALMDHVQKMQVNVTVNIKEKLRKSKDKTDEMIQELHKEIAELQNKHLELEKLEQHEDHFTLLQASQVLLNMISEINDWTQIKVYTDLYVQTARRAMSHLVQTFVAELKTLTSNELTRMKQYKETVTFNPSTAGCHLVVTEFGKRLKYYKTASSPSSDDSQRFQCPITFGRKGFTSGRHYWEVKVGLRNNWHVGVAKESVDRTATTIKKENGFFAICKRGFDYEVCCTRYTVLHLSPRPRYIGLYLDYEEGRVSFYDVTEKLHIHSFKGESFKEKLFPYFYLYSKAKKSEPLVIESL
ncbi:E3 ubiquitin-protein ligase TRIM39-like isoform 1-T2 [Pholidichthys leucotaenia]